MEKTIALFIGVLAIASLISIPLITSNNQASAQSNSCPGPKSYSIAAVGLGEYPQSYTSASGLTYIITSSVTAEAEATERAVKDCNQKLAEKLKENSKNCERYCGANPLCSSLQSINGPNTCDSATATCTSGTQSATSIMSVLSQIIPYLDPLYPHPR
jgi:hypothetical protein